MINAISIDLIVPCLCVRVVLFKSEWIMENASTNHDTIDAIFSASSSPVFLSGISPLIVNNVFGAISSRKF